MRPDIIPLCRRNRGRLAFAEMNFGGGGGILRVELPPPGATWGREQWRPEDFAFSTRARKPGQLLPRREKNCLLFQGLGQP